MKKSSLIFVACVAAILLFQYKAVIPFAEMVATSDLFMEDSGDEGSRLPTSTPMTSYAFMQCNKLIREEVDSETTVMFPSEPLQSWSLGNYQYIINAEIELSSDSGSSGLCAQANACNAINIYKSKIANEQVATSLNMPEYFIPLNKLCE
jgi:hypothetical protein